MQLESVVCYRWQPPPGYRSTFGPETVNVLKAMIRRHYAPKVRFICCTDDPAGIDRDVEIVPIWSDFSTVPSPHGGRNPSCYRRLRSFSADIGAVFGQRFVTIDLDCVITGDLRPVLDRNEDFVIWGDTNSLPGSHYNGSLVLMTAGARRKVWETFDPQTSPNIARRAGGFGSDQSWISYCLGPGEARWSKADGVYSYRNDLRQRSVLPADARIVLFHGKIDPWAEPAKSIPWVQKHWRAEETCAA